MPTKAQKRYPRALAVLIGRTLRRAERLTRILALLFALSGCITHYDDFKQGAIDAKEETRTTASTDILGPGDSGKTDAGTEDDFREFYNESYSDMLDLIAGEGEIEFGEVASVDSLAHDSGQELCDYTAFPADIACCKDSSDQTTPDTAGSILTVAEIQMSAQSVLCSVPFGSVLVATGLTFEGVVVTAGTFPYMQGLDGFYVADQSVGPWSGTLLIYQEGELANVPVGTLVDVVADHKEVFCETALWANDVMVVSEGGDGPEATVIPPEVLTGEQAESYEGILVQVNDVVVTDANPDEQDGWDLGQFVVEEALRIGNDYTLPYMSPQTDQRTEGDEFAYIRGILVWRDYKWVLMPRCPDDMELKGVR